MRQSALILILFCTPLSLSGQCFTSATEWLGKLGELETEQVRPEDRVTNLIKLENAYLKCVGQSDSVLARILHRLGDTYRLTGNFSKAIELTSHAVRINKNKGKVAQPSYLTHSYYNLALFHQLLNLPESALLYYDSCIDIGLAFPQKRFIARMAFEKMAFMHFQAGDYQRSVEVADFGVRISRQDKDVEYEALLLIQQAQAETELGKLVAAEAQLKKAMGLLQQSMLNQHLANAYNVYAFISSKRMRYQDAEAYYRKAYALNLEQSNGEQAARDLHDLALLYRNGMKNFKKALQTYQQSLQLVPRSSNSYFHALTYNNIGQVYWRNGEFSQALKFYQRALHSLPVGFTDHDVTKNPSHQSLVHVTNDYLVTAILWNKGEAWLDYFKISKDTSHLKLALDCFRSGDRMVNQMRWNQQTDQSKLFWRQRSRGWYEKAVMASYLVNDAASGFHFMEKSRAVLLNDKVSALGARDHLPIELQDQEQQLRMALKNTNTGTATGSVVDEHHWKAQQELQEFIRSIEEKYPAYYRLKYDTTVCTLKFLRERLGPTNKSWVEFFTTNEDIYAIVVTKGNVRFLRITYPDHGEVARRIIELTSSRASINSSYDEFQALAFSYYSNVFAPLKIETPRVTISMDNYLLPFDLLLVDQGAPTSFLLHKHAFSYSYAATNTFKDQQQGTEISSVLGVAPIEFQESLGLAPLHGSDGSLANIKESFNDVTIINGSRATKSEFLNRIAAFDLVLIYSHAVADSSSREPAIFLRDSALTLSSLETVKKIHTKAVLLFACNTAVGKHIRGEGIFSLARGFASVGIKSTISSLWSIDNQASYAISEGFFAHLKKGEPADVALQSARISLASSAKEFELPYYWGATIFIGDPDLILVPGREVASSWLAGLLLTFVILLSAIVFRVIRRRLKRSNRSSLG